MPPRPGGNPHAAGSRVLHVLLVFALTTAVAAFSQSRNRQVWQLAGLSDEWFGLGVNLNISGTLGFQGRPMVLRPPGYPFFIAAVLRIATGRPAADSTAYRDLAGHVVFRAQALLLGLSAALLYLWTAGMVRRSVALAAALTFGLNPYCVVLTGLLHYDVLHLLLIVAGCWSLHGALSDETSTFKMFVAGLFWGVATLVRSLTLILPVFVLLALLARGRPRIRPAAWRAAVFACGLLLAVAPWTTRNYSVSGRLIPVHLQAWAAVWGSTVKVLGIHPNHYNWFQLSGDLTSVFSRVSGEREYSYATYLRLNRELEEAFRKETLRNLREQPGVYLRNVAAAFVSFNLNINSVLLEAYQHLQTPGAELRGTFFERGHPDSFRSSRLSRLFAFYVYVLTALAFAAVWAAVRRGNRAVLAPGLVYLCLALAHALFFMDLLYYYVKLPFLVFFAFLLVAQAGPRPVRVPALAFEAPLDALLALGLALPALILTVCLV